MAGGIGGLFHTHAAFVQQPASFLQAINGPSGSGIPWLRALGRTVLAQTWLIGAPKVMQPSSAAYPVIRSGTSTAVLPPAGTNAHRIDEFWS